MALSNDDALALSYDINNKDAMSIAAKLYEFSKNGNSNKANFHKVHLFGNES